MQLISTVVGVTLTLTLTQIHLASVMHYGPRTDVIAACSQLLLLLLSRRLANRVLSSSISLRSFVTAVSVFVVVSLVPRGEILLPVIRECAPVGCW